MHDDELDISVEIVQQLILDQFPEWSHEVVEQIKSDGTVNAIYRIGTSQAARFPLRASDPSLVAAELQREASAMRELLAVCPFPAPVPIAMGRPGHHYPLPWTVQSWLAGEVATPDGCAHSEEFAKDVGELIRALRSAPTRGRCFTGTGRGGRLTDSDNWLDTCFRESREILDVRSLRALWAQFRALPRTQADVMTHSDLIPANLLVRDGRLSGVLDTGGFSPSDPALDLIAAWHLFDVEARSIFRDALGTGLPEWQRGAAWAFEQAMGLVWYYETSNPGMAQLGRSTLARIADDAELSRTLPTIR
ncbi:aminoglycoside phosphotransferase family protein [Pseudarthrobacter sp. NamE5]|uniref:aminoglycoside phosphotransferase family protein n=1 Tax=Pseudarthrobacter sp. NamE5 TaxID=2576839 RepID=UPI00110A630F|nr:aminoglycoside phosphotransferase family protein [Pseudarthrobacter sp. NamE5]TLM80849.1 aminoglycoside phosphotransferase family protein [Pseudarthrobacter sp. NamE5]